MSSLRNCPLALLLTGSLVCPLSAASPDADPRMTEYWTPQPAIVSAPAGGVPSDAIILFDGTHLDEWEIRRANPAANDPGAEKIQVLPANWILEDGAMIVPPREKTADGKNGPANTITSKRKFGSIQLHLEWRSPAQPNPKNVSQQRGNSGIFFMDRYEVQVLDCYDNETYVNGMTASVYKQHPPLVNACRPPGEWQTYDILFTAPRFAPDGTLLEKARITVMHNGVLALHNVEIYGPTVYKNLPSYQFHTPRQPLKLQDHNDPVAYRNIWVRELD